MGLDQSMHATRPDAEVFDIGDWRKHPNLHGWMEQLWITKGRPESEDCEFNCTRLYLTLTDIDAWEVATRESKLPATQGFFFGEGSDEHYLEYDLKVIKRARGCISKGWTVHYNSWW